MRSGTGNWEGWSPVVQQAFTVTSFGILGVHNYSLVGPKQLQSCGT